VKYVDLFSGCGGLSLGMENAGFELTVAVEKSDMAARTFFHNLISDASSEPDWLRYCNESLEAQLQAGVIVDQLSTLLADDKAMNFLKSESVDVVVGGPPCQGFSLAGKRNPDDVRNKLPWEFLSFVEKTNPRAVVIENVVGMKQKFSPDTESSFEQLQVALAETAVGYVVQGVEVNAMHFGAPQHRPRLMIIGLRKDVADKLGVTSSGSLWKSNFLDLLDEEIPDLAPVPTLNSKDVVTVAAAIADLSSTAPRNSKDSNSKYLRALNSKAWGVKPKGKQSIANNVLRRHNERTVLRFMVYQLFSDHGIDSRLLSRVSHLGSEEARREMELAFALLSFPAKTSSNHVLAQTEDELIDLCFDLLTKKHSQKVLKWDSPSRTVVTIPDDYVHPAEPRLFTVRELARFQGFPDDFEFLGKETTGAHRRKVEVPQYSQVGNAVSPWLAVAVGRKLRSVFGGLNEGTDRS